MTIFTIRKLTHGYGAASLLKDANLTVNKGEKLCLLGRNGTGKSTLMKIIAGIIDPDQGVIEKSPATKINMLNQTFPAAIQKNVYDVIADAQDDLEPYQIHRVISKLNLDPEAQFSDLSGGLKRRVLLARALANEPDILLLDEPTNHLDIESIQWLEGFLKSYSGTIVLVTHDRQLMQSIGTHFVEIDRGTLINWRGDYKGFLEHKEFLLTTQEKANELFDKKLAQEEIWIRQGIKARRTRNEGRVRSLKKMRDEFKQRREKIGSINISTQTNQLSGKEVFLIDNVSFSYADHFIIKNFSSVILRGDKIGILGPNGVGKSTLIKLLLSQLEPTSGIVKHGTKLEVVYYDQHREQLEEEKTIFDNVCEGSDYVIIGDKRVHIMSYLQDFLFSPQRVRTPVKALSGGERNRVMLAKLFMKSANVMILDEPTNDLDIETLELLEEQLTNYSGTVLLVSHDRSFINNIATSTWVFEGKGKVQEYAGGYDDWLLQRKIKDNKAPSPIEKAKKQLTEIKQSKLSYNEKRELDQLPKLIETLESELGKLQLVLADPTFYQESSATIAKTNTELTSIQKKLEIAYGRWEELEAKK